MKVFSDILAHEVFPAMGCTEPIACAYAAAVAAERLGAPVERLELVTDAGTYKNGAAVFVPHSGGRKGNLVAAALGAALASPVKRMELLADVTGETLARAVDLLDTHACSQKCLEGVADFEVAVTVHGGGHVADCMLRDGHTTIATIRLDNKTVFTSVPTDESPVATYRDTLRDMSVEALLLDAVSMDDETREYLLRGVEMNLLMAERGYARKGAAYQLRLMRENGIVAEDMVYRVKTRVAAAVDARMAGVPLPVMTSGGSGNQGIVAALTPYLVGQERQVEFSTIIESIGVSHALNAYIKCFVGELSVICGCAMTAGMAAAAAIVYQQRGIDLPTITRAMNNVVGDLSGLICDGAKPGCAMKAVTSVDAAIRSGFMALEGFGVSEDDGVIGKSVEESVRNLGRLTQEGMFRVDPTVIDILSHKA